MFVRVYGTPTPQGSKRGFVIPGKPGRAARAVVVDDNKKPLRTWRQDVKESTLAAMSRGGEFPMEGPIRVAVVFYLPLPKSLTKKKVALGPFRKPDLDKLTRSTFDALRAAGVYSDDAQVVDVHAVKAFGHPGALIEVKPTNGAAALIQFDDRVGFPPSE